MDIYITSMIISMRSISNNNSNDQIYNNTNINHDNKKNYYEIMY